MNYGLPYMGSKNKIAKKIVELLPSGERLVDLMAGGGNSEKYGNAIEKVFVHSTFKKDN